MEPAYVLIIEDDEIVARTIERSLRGDDFKITVTNSGVEGLKVARRRPPDLVILDIIMPGMDGYTVCREMRADPLISDVPILFLTAKIKDEDKIAGFIAGADDYLTKPFNVDELVLRVRAIIRRTHRQQTVIDGDEQVATSRKNSSNSRSVRSPLSFNGAPRTNFFTCSITGRSLGLSVRCRKSRPCEGAHQKPS